MARGKRGGKRTPRAPAAVSGPGALSQRTDGGPAKPPPVGTGNPYGERKKLEEIASVAPMYTDAAPAGSAGRQVPVDPGAMPVANAPSQRPTQPSGVGVTGTTTQVPPAQMVLRAIYDAYPSPWIRSLLDGPSR